MNGQLIREFDPALGVRFQPDRFCFAYDAGVFGPAQPELRRLDDIRKSLKDSQASGPDPVYAIAMDVGRKEHAAELNKRMLLYGVVAYAAGRLGAEPVRSQGHVHAIAPHCGWSTPELIEVWSGSAIVYLQKSVARDPETCIAVEAGPGDVVVIPPEWGHFIANADPEHEMIFGAFCDRQYAFVYDEVRRRGGLAWFPEYGDGSEIQWNSNPAYSISVISVRPAREYPELGLISQCPIYEQFVRNPERMQWISEPAIYAELWESFEP